MQSIINLMILIKLKKLNTNMEFEDIEMGNIRPGKLNP